MVREEECEERISKKYFEKLCLSNLSRVVKVRFVIVFKRSEAQMKSFISA